MASDSWDENERELEKRLAERETRYGSMKERGTSFAPDESLLWWVRLGQYGPLRRHHSAASDGTVVRRKTLSIHETDL